MLVHVKQHQMVEISGALHYGVPRNHMVVLARKTPGIIILLLRFLSGNERSERAVD